MTICPLCLSHRQPLHCCLPSPVVLLLLLLLVTVIAPPPQIAMSLVARLHCIVHPLPCTASSLLTSSLFPLPLPLMQLEGGVGGGNIAANIVTVSSSPPAHSCCLSCCPLLACDAAALDVIAIAGASVAVVVVATVLPLLPMRLQRGIGGVRTKVEGRPTIRLQNPCRQLLPMSSLAAAVTEALSKEGGTGWQ